MSTEVRLPQFGMTMETAQVVKWLKSDGEFVEQGEPLVELLNDKAVVAFEAPASGYLRIVAFEDEELPVGELLADLLDSPNEPYPPL